MGREIAMLWGIQAKWQWLDRPDREEEENTTTLLQDYDHKSGGYYSGHCAGSAYPVFKMSPMAEARGLSML